MNSDWAFQIFLIIALAAITECASQTIEITPNEKEPVREERSKYGVTCHGTNLYEFQWRGPKGIISQSQQFRVHSLEWPMPLNQTRLLLVFETVMEEDTGNYYCTASGRDNRTHNISIKLTVIKILEFDTSVEQTTDEYRDTFIRCRVKGNMSPTFMWSFKTMTFKDKTKSGKYSVEDGGLLVRNVTHLDAGNYTCRAFETTSKSSISNSTVINLKVRHKPVFLNNMEDDPVKLYVFKSDSINLTCQNSAEPVAHMTWTFEGSTFVNPFDNYIVTFTKPEKLGSYSCMASNSLGKIIRHFILIEGFKPKTPSDLTVTNVGNDYIELQVAPSDKEDELIGYQVIYEGKAVRSNGSNFESFNIININTTEGPFTLTNLKPNTEYTTKILAQNRAGYSESTQPISVRTLSIVVDSGALRLSDWFFQQLLIIFTTLLAAKL